MIGKDTFDLILIKCENKSFKNNFYMKANRISKGRGINWYRFVYRRLDTEKIP